jgi:hypothetical protein
MNELLNVLSSYAVVVPFASFIVCVGIMFISILSIGIDHPADLPADFFGVSNPMVTAGLSKIPLMVGLTLTFAPMTIMNLILESLLYEYLKIIPGIGMIIYYIVATVGLLFTFIASLFIAGYLSRPLEKIIKNSHLDISYEFKTGVVNSEFVTETYGQVKVLINNYDHFLDVVIEPGGEKINYGDTVIIKRKIEENLFIVEKI